MKNLKSKIILLILAVSLIGLLGGCSTEVDRKAIIISKDLVGTKARYYFWMDGMKYFDGKINEYEIGDTLWLKK